jgi:hypothetical protein
VTAQKRTTIVHVNQLVIRGNAKRGEMLPPLAIRGKSRSRKVVYGHEAELILNGEVVGRFVYRPCDPLDCGAKLWFETDVLEVRPVVFDQQQSEKQDEQ